LSGGLGHPIIVALSRAAMRLWPQRPRRPLIDNPRPPR
jgi:hypothetical protein